MTRNGQTRQRSKRASYRFGVRWIALNDEPDSVDVDEIAGYVSTLLLADLFGKNPYDVATAVAKERTHND